MAKPDAALEAYSAEVAAVPEMAQLVAFSSTTRF
jgi:hypothetical protein